MAYKQKDMTGVLFPNKKEKDKQPDFTGKVVIANKFYYLSGWKQYSHGKNYLSLAVSVPQGKENSHRNQREENPFD